jgi:hypothetical protein
MMPEFPQRPESARAAGLGLGHRMYFFTTGGSFCRMGYDTAPAAVIFETPDAQDGGVQIRQILPQLLHNFSVIHGLPSSFYERVSSSCMAECRQVKISLMEFCEANSESSGQSLSKETPRLLQYPYYRQFQYPQNIPAAAECSCGTCNGRQEAGYQLA